MVIDNNDIPKQDYMVLCSTITYNQAPYITDTMNGFCMQQTSFSYACYIIDDASTDGEQDVIKAYLDEHFQMDKAEQYELELANVIVAKHNTNPNCTFAVYLLKRNLWKEPDLKRPLGHPWTQRCKYIAICEGDDYWTDPHKLQKQVDFLDTHPNVGLCYTDCDIYYEDENRWQRAIYTTTGETFNATNILHKRKVGYMANNTWVYRKSLYEQIPPNPGFIDGALYLLYNMCLLSDVEYVNGVTSVYRRHVGSASCFSDADGHKAYQYHKSCFLLALFIAPKFPNSEKNLNSSYNYALFSLYESALKYNDKEIIEKIDYYFSPLLDMKMFKDLISQKQQYERTQYSIAYKLGRLLLRPLKWLKTNLYN